MIKLKIPAVVTMGASKYSVKLRKDLKNDDGYRGCIHLRTEEILIDPGQPKSMMLSSFLHEVIHAINEHYECRIDEDTTSRIAEGIAEFLVCSCDIEFDWEDITEK